jgi:acyl carrier protein
MQTRSEISETAEEADSVHDRVIEIIAECMALDRDGISREMSLINDLNADSLETIEIVMSIEDEFDMLIDDDQIADLHTIGGVIDYVADHA